MYNDPQFLQTDEDPKNKKAEAKKYLDDQMAEARTKAQEEINKWFSGTEGSQATVQDFCNLAGS